LAVSSGGWRIAGGGIAIGLVVAVVAFDAIVRLPAWRSGTIAGGLLAPIMMMPAVIVCFSAIILRDEPSRYELPGALLDSNVAPVDLGRLPNGVRLDEVDCANLGAHGSCVDVFIVRATDGASNEQLVVRLAEHFNRHGWALQPNPT
jgi:hypothetical protein